MEGHNGLLETDHEVENSDVPAEPEGAVSPNEPLITIEVGEQAERKTEDERKTEETPADILEKLVMDEDEFNSFIKPIIPQHTSVENVESLPAVKMPEPTPEQEMLHSVLAKEGALLFTETDDPISEQALMILKSLSLKTHMIRLDLIEGGEVMKTQVFNYSGMKSLPIIFVNGQLIGGYEELWYLYYTQLTSLIVKRGHPSFKENFSFTYELIVIGGGPAGISAALEAAKLGKRVVIVNYVAPTSRGRTWGIGGTYINAGSISKNLMYTASSFVHSFSGHGPSKFKKGTPNWEKLVSDICEHIKSITFSLRSKMKEAGCEYVNGRAKFISDHSIEVSFPKERRKRLMTSSVYILATGSRPRYPKYIQGSLKHCLTTDDFFWSPRPPGKTLIITSSHIGLECATILANFNFPVTVLILPPTVQDIDWEIMRRAKSHMEKMKIRFLRGIQIETVEAVPPGASKHNLNVKGLSTKGIPYEENYDTVLLECGRFPNTAHLGLCRLGINVHKRSRKVIVDDESRTNIKHIFALGDIVHGTPEIGTFAKKAGKTLIQRMYKGYLKYVDMSFVPERILFPVEYGKIGKTEQAAMALFGDKVKAYEADSHILGTLSNSTLRAYFYMKILCLQREKKEEVISIHMLCHKAAEILQGMSISLYKGVSKSDFEEMIALHPIFSEAVSNMKIRCYQTPIDVYKALKEEDAEKTALKAIQDIAQFKKRRCAKVKKGTIDQRDEEQEMEESSHEKEIQRNKGPRISKSMERFIIEVIIKGKDDYLETDDEEKEVGKEERSSGSEESDSESSVSTEESSSSSGENGTGSDEEEIDEESSEEDEEEGNDEINESNEEVEVEEGDNDESSSSSTNTDENDPENSKEGN